MHMLALGLLGLLELRTGAAAAPWRCSSDASCQLNGVCVGGACQCDPSWTGSNQGETDRGFRGFT